MTDRWLRTWRKRAMNWPPDGGINPLDVFSSVGWYLIPEVRISHGLTFKCKTAPDVSAEGGRAK